MNLLKWVVGDSVKYAALAIKDANSLYFLEDTREIYKGTIPYTEPTVFYATTLPVKGAQGKIYIENTTLKGSVWTGSAWKDIIQPLAQTVDVLNTTAGVTGKAVADYVANSVSTQVVTNIAYDDATKQIKFTKNGTDTALTLSKLGTLLEYNGSTGVITMKDATGTAISTVNIPLDNFVKNGAYNATTNALELEMQNGSIVSIPAADLVALYEASDTSSVDLTISNIAGVNTISATVKLSATANNGLVINTDGLYLDKQAIIDGIINTVATTAVQVSNIVVDAASIDTDTSSSTKVISEKAFVEAMSWNVLN